MCRISPHPPTITNTPTKNDDTMAHHTTTCGNSHQNMETNYSAYYSKATSAELSYITPNNSSTLYLKYSLCSFKGNLRGFLYCIESRGTAKKSNLILGSIVFFSSIVFFFVKLTIRPVEMENEFVR